MLSPCRLGVPDVSGVSQDLSSLGFAFFISVAEKAAELIFDIRGDTAQTARHRGSRTILHSIFVVFQWSLCMAWYRCMRRFDLVVEFYCCLPISKCRLLGQALDFRFVGKDFLFWQRYIFAVMLSGDAIFMDKYVQRAVCRVFADTF